MNRRKVCIVLPLALILASAGAVKALPSRAPAQAALTNQANYVLRLEWKETNAPPRSLQVTSTEGTFQLNTSQPGAAKVGDTDYSISVTVNGDLTVLNPDEGRLRLFLGRTVPYATARSGSGSNAPTTIQQRQEGLTVTVVVTFGKPLVLQKDENGEVTVLVKRE